MKGKLNKTEEGWVVVYDQRTFQDPAAEDGVIKLHPADAKTCDNYGDYSVDWIGKEVEFVIENYNYGGTYAKITEQMIDKKFENQKPLESNTNMTPEVSKLIVGSKVTSHYVMTKEMEHELNQVFDNIQVRFTHEVVKRFTDEMVASRWKDVKIEEGPNFFDDTRYTLELFVFNRQELNELIQAIENIKYDTERKS